MLYIIGIIYSVEKCIPQVHNNVQSEICLENIRYMHTSKYADMRHKALQVGWGQCEAEWDIKTLVAWRNTMTKLSLWLYYSGHLHVCVHQLYYIVAVLQLTCKSLYGSVHCQTGSLDTMPTSCTQCHLCCTIMCVVFKWLLQPAKLTQTPDHWVYTYVCVYRYLTERDQDKQQETLYID